MPGIRILRDMSLEHEAQGNVRVPRVVVNAYYWDADLLRGGVVRLVLSGGNALTTASVFSTITQNILDAVNADNGTPAKATAADIAIS